MRICIAPADPEWLTSAGHVHVDVHMPWPVPRPLRSCACIDLGLPLTESMATAIAPRILMLQCSKPALQVLSDMHCLDARSRKDGARVRFSHSGAVAGVQRDDVAMAHASWPYAYAWRGSTRDHEIDVVLQQPWVTIISAKVIVVKITW